MIFKENLTINGREFIRTYSDTYTVMREGVEYDEAIDPAEFLREYTESTRPLENEQSENNKDV